MNDEIGTGNAIGDWDLILERDTVLLLLILLAYFLPFSDLFLKEKYPFGGVGALPLTPERAVRHLNWNSAKIVSHRN